MSYGIAGDGSMEVDRDGEHFRWVEWKGTLHGILTYAISLGPALTDPDEGRYLAHVGAIQQSLMTGPVAGVIGLPPVGEMPVDPEDLPASVIRPGPTIVVDGEEVEAWYATAKDMDFALADPTCHPVAVLRAARCDLPWPALRTIRPVA